MCQGAEGDCGCGRSGKWEGMGREGKGKGKGKESKIKGNKELELKKGKIRKEERVENNRMSA